MNKEEKSRYDRDYQKRNMRQYSFWLNKKKDADLIQWLDSSEKGTTSEHIKSILRNAMISNTEK